MLWLQDNLSLKLYTPFLVLRNCPSPSCVQPIAFRCLSIMNVSLGNQGVITFRIIIFQRQPCVVFTSCIAAKCTIKFQHTEHLATPWNHSTPQIGKV